MKVGFLILIAVLLPPPGLSVEAGEPTGTSDGEKEEGGWRAPDERRAVPNPVPAGPESVERGGDLYTTHCLSCHGPTGKGDGPVPQRLGFEAGDLTDPDRHRRQTDGEIFWKIQTGRDPMPGFDTLGLEDEQIWDLVNYTRSLRRATEMPPDP